MSTPELARRSGALPALQVRMPRELPHNLEAEQAVLGAILIEETAFDLVADRLRAEDFYLHAHQLVFQACSDLAQEKQVIDPVLLHQRLEAKGLLGGAVPSDLPFALAKGLGTAANVRHYASIVAELARVRRVQLVAQAVLNRGYEAGASVQEFLETAQQDIFAAAQGRSSDTLRLIHEPMVKAIHSLDAIQARVRAGESTITGVPTGLQALDQKLLGLQPGALIVLAARPSVGKTALALNIGTHAAVKAHKQVAIFSLEMPSEQLAMRILAAEARLDFWRLSQGLLNPSDWDRIMSHGDRIGASRIWLDDNFMLSPVELRAKCRKIKREGGLDLVVVDYLQLMNAPGAQSREQEIAIISRSLKSLAKELDIPILALSQLNRGVEKRKGEAPMLSDLRESGAIEQDADVVMFLHRPDEKEGGEGSQQRVDVQEIELHIAKQRQGPTGVVDLVFFKTNTFFAEKQRGASD
ncbi:MAG TPA: replicative DNA helicase [Anaeromyxobacteraceae bacterium]|nr:replicative DNA helicase [Anaeromyxobacteraceae bacterium]